MPSLGRAGTGAGAHGLPLNAYLVEDNPAIRDSLAEALAELADIRTVGHAGKAQEAIAWLTDPAHPWDLAVVDLLLEDGGSGLDVLKAVRGRDPARQVIVLTATANQHVRQQCLALGCDSVFDKSMQTEALLDWCVALAAPGRQPGD
jgi:DNA-binding NarL/FixJ family response regulator